MKPTTRKENTTMKHTIKIDDLPDSSMLDYLAGLMETEQAIERVPALTATAQPATAQQVEWFINSAPDALLDRLWDLMTPLTEDPYRDRDWSNIDLIPFTVADVPVDEHPIAQQYVGACITAAIDVGFAVGLAA